VTVSSSIRLASSAFDVCRLFDDVVGELVEVAHYLAAGAVHRT
jgi:hypothetical protein